MKEYFADYAAPHPSLFTLTPAMLADGGDDPPNVGDQYRADLTVAAALSAIALALPATCDNESPACYTGLAFEPQEEAGDTMGEDEQWREEACDGGSGWLSLHREAS